MSDASWRDSILNFFVEALVPMSVILMMLLTTLPVGIPITAKLGGLLPLIAISYWTLTRPRDLPPLMTFILGVVTDIFMMTPLGMHAFAFVLAQTILIKERRFLMGQGFWVLWAAFFLLCGGVYAVLWGLMTALSKGHAAMPFWRGIFSVGLAWALMPPILIFLSGVDSLIDLFDDRSQDPEDFLHE
jgi:rod shape-determining protein MreD